MAPRRAAVAVMKVYGKGSGLVSGLAGSIPTREKLNSNRRTALYTYLESNLKSARLRRLLEEGAAEHEPESPVAREREQVDQVVLSRVPSFGRLLMEAPLEAEDLPKREGGLRSTDP